MFKPLGGNLLFSTLLLLRTFLPLVIAAAFLNLAPLPAFSSKEMDVVNVTSITEDATWEGGKIYRVSETKTINANVTLTIEPGAVVKFVNNATLYVYGTIKAIGAPEELIYFTKGNDTSPGMGQAVEGSAEWNGIWIRAAGDGELEHVQIRYAKEWGIRFDVTNGNLVINQSTFHSNKEGIRINGGNSIIENSIFSSNTRGIRFFALNGGHSSIRGNIFFMDTSNSMGLDIHTQNVSVNILENTFWGSGLPSTVGINLSTSEDPENRLISMMFNTFESIGKGVGITLGGHILRGNYFLSAYDSGVYFSSTPALGQKVADIRYNYWNHSGGPSYQGNIGKGVTIKEISLLEFEPWGTRQYIPHYDPLEAAIDHPRDGAYVIGAAEFRVFIADPNLKELAFFLDEDEICRFEEVDFVNGSGTYSCLWELPEEDTAKERYILTVKAANHLGEKVEESLTFKYLRETPPFPELKITSPQQGSSLSGNVNVLIEAEAAEELGGNGLGYLYLEINGELAAQSEAPYTSLTWEFETGSYNNGHYLLTVKTADILGQEIFEQISIIVDNRTQAPDQYQYWDDTPSDVEETKERNTELDKEKADHNSDEIQFSEEDEDPVLRCASEIFKDLGPDHPALEAISFLYARGIFRGVDTDRFAPGMHLSRAQAAALLMRMPLHFKSRGDQAFSEEFFKDVDRGTWFSSTVNQAAALGLLGGYGDGTFRPLSPVSGAEFAALLLRLERFLLQNGEYTDRNKLARIDQELGNATLGKTPLWARESTALLMRRGVLGNNELQWFEPRQPLSRAEAAILLWKACLYYKIR
ncbi:MAG: S-layer homology domain-containing protein [Bacillota bacterium]|nr:S-layer homology domain-containing protein [Bacillota bacterium]